VHPTAATMNFLSGEDTPSKELYVDLDEESEISSTPAGWRRKGWCLAAGAIAGVMLGGAYGASANANPSDSQTLETIPMVVPHTTTSSFDKSTSSKPATSTAAWRDRDDVQAMQKMKVTYGELHEDDVKGLFTKFKSDFRRNYADDDEESKRFGLFKASLKNIDFLNTYNPLALFGITETTDRTSEERAQNKMSDKWSSYDAMKSALPSEMVEMAGQGPDAVTGQSFSRRLEGSVGSMSDGEFAWASEDDCAACTTYPGFKEYTSENRPTNFDWRELGAVTSVKNQKYCGSCWTFSTAQDIEGTHFLATGNLTSFSEQQFVACDTYNYGCDGGWMFAAMQYVADFGILVSEEAYPYMGVMMTYNLPTPTCDTDLLNSKLEGDGDDVAHIEGYQMVAMGAEYEDLMATYMLKNGPLSIAINANGMDYYVHGIVGCETIAGSEYCEAGAIDAPSDGDSTMEHTCNPTDLDHGVLLVAYGEQDGVDYWVIKNSWAETWGEDGYYRIERGVNKCGVSNFAQHSVYKKA